MVNVFPTGGMMMFLAGQMAPQGRNFKNVNNFSLNINQPKMIGKLKIKIEAQYVENEGTCFH